MKNNGALAGIKVLDLSRLLPGPFCSMILADHGADVIVIEDKRYMTSGHYLPEVNRNKQHMTLNLKTEEGKEIFFKMAADADVIIEGFRPGTVKRLGIDYERVCKVNPAIIYCSITGYGQTGSYKEIPGHDVNYMSISGLLDQIGPADGSPTIPGVQFADMAGGGMNGAIGILLALVSRERTGQGQYIDVSMTDSMVSFMPVVHRLLKLTGTVPHRSQSLLSNYYACYHVYQTSDHNYFSVGALEPHFWEKLCRHFDLLEYAPLQFDQARRKEIINAFEIIFSTKTRAQWVEELTPLNACCAPVLSPDEVLDLPLFRERKMVIATKNADRADKKMIGIPVKLSKTPGKIRTSEVKFGENTRSILTGMGYSSEQIKDFFDRKIV
jgi:crotonobetainyl-CoA:carnitine CoA-transferase CaiB-like acyl-CoA transferase